MRINIKKKYSSLVLSALLFSFSGHALELNWSGQFWSEWHYLKNYTLDGSSNGERFDPARASAAVGGALADPGYYIPSGGSSSASFETLFMRLKPQLVVNDSVYLKSELWAGDPIFGLFGNAVPYTVDQRQYYSNQSRGSFVTAQRFWIDVLSDFGTLQVGRAPLDWGLGVVWNKGDELWSRYPSTGDLVRLVSKFGSFSFSPTIAIYSNGNNVGGSCTVATVGGATVCAAGQGNGGISDYSLSLNYENQDEELEGGVNLIKRIAGPVQDRTSLALGNAVQANYNLWDIYARKKIGQFTFAGELPVFNGTLGSMDYSGYALAGDIHWKPSETWETRLRFGRAPGQPGADSANPTGYRAFFFNPNYHVGMILFNYQLANFVGPNTSNQPAVTTSLLKSPFDHPINNVTYLSVGESFKTEKWTLSAALIHARALETAASGRYFFHTWQRTMVKNNTGKDQENGLGTEIDLGAAFQWDDHFFARVDSGIWFPGAFYKFSNTATDNATDSVWATAAKVGVTF